MDKKQGITGLRIINFAMLIDPLILLGIAFYMKYNLGYEPSPEFYEVNGTIRIVQYFLYLSGLGVFFFADAITHPFKKRLSGKSDTASKIKYNIVSMAVLDYIGISGFIGFLISGNLPWVLIFCVIAFFSRLRFINKNACISTESST